MVAGSLPARFWSTGGPYRPACSPRRPEAQAPLGLQRRSLGTAGEDRPDRPVLGVLLAQGPQRPPPRRTAIGEYSPCSSLSRSVMPSIVTAHTDRRLGAA